MIVNGQYPMIQKTAMPTLPKPTSILGTGGPIRRTCAFGQHTKSGTAEYEGRANRMSPETVELAALKQKQAEATFMSPIFYREHIVKGLNS
jgi:hypothetical protein